jgi:hypothetical protein
VKAPRGLPKTIDEIRQSAREGRVHFTLKALRELAALDLGLDETDVCEILTELTEGDFRSRVVSPVTLEYLYVFASKVADIEIYLKVVVRSNCVVISFHEDLKDES